MIENGTYQLNDYVEMKKTHPCGSQYWQIVRMGADIKIKCTGCGHIVMMPRSKFNRAAKTVIEQEKFEI